MAKVESAINEILDAVLEMREELVSLDEVSMILIANRVYNAL
jgi:hypothetical protein